MVHCGDTILFFLATMLIQMDKGSKHRNMLCMGTDTLACLNIPSFHDLPLSYLVPLAWRLWWTATILCLYSFNIIPLWLHNKHSSVVRGLQKKNQEVTPAGMPYICELSRLRSAGITLRYGVYQVLPTLSGSATGCYCSRAEVYIWLPQGGGGRPGYYGYLSYVTPDR